MAKVLKKVKNAVLYDDGTILIERVRFSHPHLGEAYAGKNDDGSPQAPAFSVTGMLPKATHKEAKDLCVEVIDDLLKENKIRKLAPDKKFIRNGDDSDREEYDGHWTVSAREKRRPSLRHANKAVMTPDEAEKIFYGGCWGTILIKPWFQNNTYGKRVNSGIIAAQFWREDDAFGEGRITDEELDDRFDSYDDGNDDDDPFGGDDDDDL